MSEFLPASHRPWYEKILKSPLATQFPIKDDYGTDF